jgi:hypothetical protein
MGFPKLSALRPGSAGRAPRAAAARACGSPQGRAFGPLGSQTKRIGSERTGGETHEHALHRLRPVQKTQDKSARAPRIGPGESPAEDLEPADVESIFGCAATRVTAKERPGPWIRGALPQTVEQGKIPETEVEALSGKRMNAAGGVAEEEKTRGRETQAPLDEKREGAHGSLGRERPENGSARFGQPTTEFAGVGREKDLGAGRGQGPDEPEGAVGPGEKTERSLAGEDLPGDAVVGERRTHDAHERAFLRIVDPAREARQPRQRSFAALAIENDPGAVLAAVLRAKPSRALGGCVGDEARARPATKTRRMSRKRVVETAAQARSGHHRPEHHAPARRRREGERSALAPANLHAVVHLDFVAGHMLPGPEAIEERDRRGGESVEPGILAGPTALLAAQPHDRASAAEGKEDAGGGHGTVADDENFRLFLHVRPQP